MDYTKENKNVGLLDFDWILRCGHCTQKQMQV